MLLCGLQEDLIFPSCSSRSAPEHHIWLSHSVADCHIDWTYPNDVGKQSRVQNPTVTQDTALKHPELSNPLSAWGGPWKTLRRAGEGTAFLLAPHMGRPSLSPPCAHGSGSPLPSCQGWGWRWSPKRAAMSLQPNSRRLVSGATLTFLSSLISCAYTFVLRYKSLN